MVTYISLKSAQALKLGQQIYGIQQMDGEGLDSVQIRKKTSLNLYKKNEKI